MIYFNEYTNSDAHGTLDKIALDKQKQELYCLNLLYIRLNCKKFIFYNKLLEEAEILD